MTYAQKYGMLWYFMMLISSMALRLELTDVGSHYPERASALHFKDAATPKVGHMIADVVFNLFIETRFLH